MNKMAFDYNTQRERMNLPEYGRNVQKMVDHIKTIEDREERNRAAKSIIQIMGNLNPNLRDIGDFKHKLWDHLTIISRFDLDIDAPYPQPLEESLTAKPNTVPYNEGEIKVLHYGRVVEMMIEAAIEMEEGDKKEYFKLLIANQMKKCYLTWNNRGHSITDQIILKDMHELSGGVLSLPEDTKLMEVKDLFTKKPQAPAQRKKGTNQGKKRYHKKH
jgi:hypothetical protein